MLKNKIYLIFVLFLLIGCFTNNSNMKNPEGKNVFHTEVHQNGNLKQVTYFTYHQGKMVINKVETFFENGKPKTELSYYRSEKRNQFIELDENGNIINMIIYD